MQYFGRDFRYALRGLAKSPGFTLVGWHAVLAGIDRVSNAANEPERERRYREDLRCDGLRHYFSTLGVEPAIGAIIGEEDDRKPGSGGPRGPVTVLSYGLWCRRFGGDPSVVGRTVNLNGQPFTVAGVAARGFAGTEVGQTLDVFAPMMLQSTLMPGNGNALDGPRNNWLRMMGRLMTPTSGPQSEAELSVLLQRFNGVMAYAVGQRTREIGIRMALGADRSVILTHVLREAGVMALTGMLLGVPLAYALTKLVSSMLYGIGPTDPASACAAAAALGIAALIAAWIPARRATRVDPLVALRCE